jgi:hypothetical protein
MEEISKQSAKAAKFLSQVNSVETDMGGFLSKEMQRRMPVIASIPARIKDENPDYFEKLLVDDQEWDKFLRRNPQYKVKRRKKWY